MSKRFVERAITATPNGPRHLHGRSLLQDGAQFEPVKDVHLVTGWLRGWDESLARTLVRRTIPVMTAAAPQAEEARANLLIVGIHVDNRRHECQRGIERRLPEHDAAADHDRDRAATATATVDTKSPVADLLAG
jgi:hypothetical protein